MGIESLTPSDGDKAEWERVSIYAISATDHHISQTQCKYFAQLNKDAFPSSSLDQRRIFLLHPEQDVEKDFFAEGVLNLSSSESRPVSIISPKESVSILTPTKKSEKATSVHKKKHKKKKGFLKRCVHGVKKAAKALKKFVKKHKKAILAAAAVIAAAAGAATIAARRKTEKTPVPPSPERDPSESPDPATGNYDTPHTSSSIPSVSIKTMTSNNYPELSQPLTSPDPFPLSAVPLSSFFSAPVFENPSTPYSDWNSAGSPSWNPQLSTISDLVHGGQPLATYPLPISSGSPASHVKNFPLSPSSSFAMIDADSPPRVYHAISEPRRSQILEIDGKKLARGAIGVINGMGNNLEDVKGPGNYFHQLAGNHQIQWVYNCSHSIPVDIAESVFLNYQGISAPAKLLKENWVAFHEQHKNDPQAKYLQFCHSQGAIHVKNALLDAPQEIRDRVIVIAIAPATIIPRKLCADSFNYASELDPVPYAEAALAGLYAGADDSFLLERAQEKRAELNELIRLKPHPDACWPDHGILSPTFSPVIEKHLKIYSDEFEVLK